MEQVDTMKENREEVKEEEGMFFPCLTLAVCLGIF